MKKIVLYPKKDKEMYNLIIPFKTGGYYTFELADIINAWLEYIGLNLRTFGEVCDISIDKTTKSNDEKLYIGYKGKNIYVRATKDIVVYEIKVLNK